MMDEAQIISALIPAVFQEADIKLSGNYLTITNMYAKPDLAVDLDGDLSIAGHIRRALGVKEVEVYDDNLANQGCESCDYGSSYGWEFKITWE